MNYTGYVRTQQLSGNYAAKMVAPYIKRRADRATDVRQRIARDLQIGLIGATRFARLIAAVNNLSRARSDCDTVPTPPDEWSSYGHGGHIRAAHIPAADLMEEGEAGYVRS